MARYRHDPDHPARLNKQGRPEPTRQPRYANRLYCLIWPDHDLFKLGLGSGKNARDASALQSITKYFGHEAVVPGAFVEWRAELPELEGAAWGDCQRFEMVFATAVKRRLGASAADAVALEWLTRPDLDHVVWKDELGAAAAEAMRFSGLEGTVEWAEYTPRRATHPHAAHPRIHGPSQLDAHRTMRNNRGVCAMKGCGAPLHDAPVGDGRFRYCSADHASVDSQARAAAGG
jgi:hypothetical protein